MSNYKQIIHFDGRNLNDIFRLSCVRAITKGTDGLLVVKIVSILNGVVCCHVGEHLAEGQNGTWHVLTKEEYQSNCSVCCDSIAATKR